MSEIKISAVGATELTVGQMRGLLDNANLEDVIHVQADGHGYSLTIIEGHPDAPDDGSYGRVLR